MNTLTTKTNASSSGERKQVTALFIDLVDFSRIASVADPEDLQEGLDEYYTQVKAIIDQYNGHITEYLGDGVVAMFGFPQADELAASKAVQAALEVVKSSPGLKIVDSPVDVRAGIATGDVATRADTPGSALPKVTGMVTTLAERIQSKAETGTVYISQSTQSVLRGSFVLTKIPDQVLKGFAEPQTLFRAESGVSDSQAAANTFAGRKDDLAVLSQTNTPLLVFGPAGIGKSALVRAFCDMEPGLMRIQTFQSEGISANSSYHAFTNWLLGVLPNKTASIENLKTTFSNVDSDGLRYLALLLGLPEGMGLMTEVSNLLLRSGIENNLWLAISGFAPNGALIFEDLHWMDEASFGVVRHIISQNAADSHKIILTSRTNQVVQDHLLDQGLTEHKIAPLNSADCSAMLEQVAQTAIDSKYSEQLIERSGGNPLFLEQLALNQSDANTSLPATLKDLLTERLDKSETAKPTLQMAAVIGQNFRLDILQAVLGDDADTAGHLETAIDLSIVRRIDDNEFIFAHALLHETAYDSLLRKNMRLNHGAVAATLVERHPDIVARNPALLGEHLLLSGAISQSIPCFLGAAKLALYQGAFVDAETQVNRAISVSDTLDDGNEKSSLQIGCYTELGAVLMQHQGFTAPPVIEAFNTVLQIAHKSDNMDGSVVPALWGSFTHAVLAGEMEKARHLNEMVWNISARSTNAINAVELRLAALGVANADCFYNGDFSTQYEHISEIRDLYQITEHAQLIPSYGMDIFATAQMFEPVARAITGHFDMVAPLLEETDNHQSVLGIPLMAPYAKIWGSVPLFYSGQIEDALVRITQGVELATEQGAAFWLATGALWKTIFELKQQPSQEGVDQLAGLIDIQLAMGSEVAISYFKSCLAEAMGQLGDVEAAFELSTSAMEIAKTKGSRTWKPEVHRIHAELAQKMDDQETARAAIVSGIELADEQNADLWLMRSMISANKTGVASYDTELRSLYESHKHNRALPEVQQAELVLTL